MPHRDGIGWDGWEGAIRHKWEGELILWGRHAVGGGAYNQRTARCWGGWYVVGWPMFTRCLVFMIRCAR